MEHSKHMRLGGGGRFAALAAKAKKGGAKNPEGVSAAAGMKKYGKAKMSKMAQAGKKRRKRFSKSDFSKKAY